MTLLIILSYMEHKFTYSLQIFISKRTASWYGRK